MKTSEQLTKEVLEKIQQKETKRQRRMNTLRKACMVLVLGGIILPSAIIFSLPHDDAQPMDLPSQQTPFDEDQNGTSDESNEDILHNNQSGGNLEL